MDGKIYVRSDQQGTLFTKIKYIPIKRSFKKVIIYSYVIDLIFKAEFEFIKINVKFIPHLLMCEIMKLDICFLWNIALRTELNSTESSSFTIH